jgi:hypothetical protein
MMLAEGPDAPPIGVLKVPPMPGVAGFVAPAPPPPPVAVPFPVLVPAALELAGYLQDPVPAEQQKLQMRREVDDARAIGRGEG